MGTHLTSSIEECVVIKIASYVCHDRNNRALSFFVYIPGLDSIDSFQFVNKVKTYVGANQSVHH